MYKPDIDKEDVEDLAYAWESTGVPLEEISELVLSYQSYIEYLENLIPRGFEEEFMAK
jgi:hypothetical protein